MRECENVWGIMSEDLEEHANVAEALQSESIRLHCKKGASYINTFQVYCAAVFRVQ